MRCSQNWARPMHELLPVLVREAGIAYRPALAADPVAAWMDLMEAVEVLCPRWPPRDQPPRSNGFVL